MAKLTEHQVLEIYNSDKHPKEYAKMYGINPSHVHAIRAGRTWSKLTGGLPNNQINRDTVYTCNKCGRGWQYPITSNSNYDYYTDFPIQQNKKTCPMCEREKDASK